MKKLIIALAICFALTPAVWAGSATPNVDQGTMQLGLYGSYDGNHPLDYQLVLDGAIGYFVIDNLEITSLLGWQSNELSDNLQAGLGTRYHFTFGSPWVPFVELAVLYAATELDDSVYNDFDSPDWDAWLLRAGAGIQYFFTDSVALSLKGVYDYATDDIYPDQDGNLDDYNWKALLGINVYIN